LHATRIGHHPPEYTAGVRNLMLFPERIVENLFKWLKTLMPEPAIFMIIPFIT
jgi:hypothetical protein